MKFLILLGVVFSMVTILRIKFHKSYLIEL